MLLKKNRGRFRALACALLAALLLAGCTGTLPEGMDKDALIAKSQNAIAQVNEGDYEALIGSMREDVQNLATPEAWGEALAPYLDAAGAFIEFGDSEVVSQQQDGETITAALVQAKYENLDMVYAVYFDTGSEIIGFYLSDPGQ